MKGQSFSHLYPRPPLNHAKTGFTCLTWSIWMQIRVLRVNFDWFGEELVSVPTGFISLCMLLSWAFFFSSRKYCKRSFEIFIHYTFVFVNLRLPLVLFDSSANYAGSPDNSWNLKSCFKTKSLTLEFGFMIMCVWGGESEMKFSLVNCRRKRNYMVPLLQNKFFLISGMGNFHGLHLMLI